jgi:SAM-dependent methyltransferase
MCTRPVLKTVPEPKIAPERITLNGTIAPEVPKVGSIIRNPVVLSPVDKEHRGPTAWSIFAAKPSRNMSRIDSTIQDLVALERRKYCDLGPGKGAISLGLKNAGRSVIGVEAPWANPEDFAWAKDKGITVHREEFFTGDLSRIDPEVDCFILAHCIAHFRFSPYILFQKIHAALPSGGMFYLSTVNGASFDRVLKLFRGIPVTERVPPRLAQRALDISKDWNRTGMPQIWDDWMHVKEYTLPEIEELFRNAGFSIVRASHRNNYPQWNRSTWKKNMAIKVFPRMADELVVIGRKA